MVNAIYVMCAVLDEINAIKAEIIANNSFWAIIWTKI